VTARRPAALALLVALLLAFALLVLVAGSLNPGYLHARDYVSYLASRGADQAWIGILALVTFSAAHFVTALIVRLSWRGARIVWVPLLACSFFGIITALSRVSCPGGAAGCSHAARAAVSDLWDHLHGLSVGAYELSFVVAATCAGVVLAKGRRRWAGASLLVVAVLSALVFRAIHDPTPGVEQRIWLVVNALGLVAMARFGQQQPAPTLGLASNSRHRR